MPTKILVAPAGRGVGLTTACMGIVRAFERQGIHAAFVKPIANRERVDTADLLALTGHAVETESIPRNLADELLASGDDQLLMEHVVEVVSNAGRHADVLVVEGLTPESGMVHSSRVNALMLKALDAELVLVASPRGERADEVAGAAAIAARGFGALIEGRTVGCILNRVCGGATPGAAAAQTETETIGPACAGCVGFVGNTEALEAEYRAALEAEQLLPVAIVACNLDLAAPRVRDVARAIGASFMATGRADVQRVRDVAICAGTVPTALKVMRPGTLVLTPGDRNDILLTTALAVQDGTPLAGVVLTVGLQPDPAVSVSARRPCNWACR